MGALHWVTGGPPTPTDAVTMRDHSWQVFCLSLCGMMWTLPRRGLKKTHSKQGQELRHAVANMIVSAFTNRSCQKKKVNINQWVRTTNAAAGKKTRSRATLRQSPAARCLCASYGFRCVYSPKLVQFTMSVWSIIRRKSSLSYKEKALKSYYDSERLHCFPPMLQCTGPDANAN